MIEIDDNCQLQLVIQYYKSQGDDDYGLWFGKNMFVVISGGKVYIIDGFNFDCIFGIECYLISFQYFDVDFFGQNLVSQVYYCDEFFIFYLFLMFMKGQVSSFFLLQQDIDQYGVKLIFNS